MGEGGRSAARQPALRRAVGASLARSRPVRRHELLRARRQQAACLAVSRLRHPLAQRRQAVRPVRGRATRRRRIARGDERFVHCDGLLPARRLGRRASRQAAVEVRLVRRHRGDHRTGFSRFDGQLRPLPRPQDRSDPAARLLQPARVLRQHRADGRQADEPRQCRAAALKGRGRSAGVRPESHRLEPPPPGGAAGRDGDRATVSRRVGAAVGWPGGGR